MVCKVELRTLMGQPAKRCIRVAHTRCISVAGGHLLELSTPSAGTTWATLHAVMSFTGKLCIDGSAVYVLRYDMMWQLYGSIFAVFFTTA